MSNISQGNELTSTELTVVENLAALAASGTGEFIRKTGSTTFENATPSGTGSTLTKETPTGNVNDSNTSFTVAHEPLYIVVNGSQYAVGEGLYQSYVAGTISLTSPVGVGGFIRSYYNA